MPARSREHVSVEVSQANLGTLGVVLATEQPLGRRVPLDDADARRSDYDRAEATSAGWILRQRSNRVVGERVRLSGVPVGRRGLVGCENALERDRTLHRIPDLIAARREVKENAATVPPEGV